MFKKFFSKFEDKVSFRYLTSQVLENAYGNGDTPIAKLDPRILILWYCFFGVVPWFINDVALLLLIFLFVFTAAVIAHIAPLVLILFSLGVLSQTGALLIISLFFGGGHGTIVPILILTLKIVVVSLASLLIFSGLPPDRLALGFLWFGFPDQLVFSISFAYRIVPVLLDEFQNIVYSYRLRGKAPDQTGVKGKLLYVIYRIKIIVLSFYPLMLNMAKRSRTITESLVLKGYLFSLNDKKVKRIKLSALQLRRQDALFILMSITWVMASLPLSGVINKVFLML